MLNAQKGFQRFKDSEAACKKASTHGCSSVVCRREMGVRGQDVRLLAKLRDFVVGWKQNSLHNPTANRKSQFHSLAPGAAASASTPMGGRFVFEQPGCRISRQWVGPQHPKPV